MTTLLEQQCDYNQNDLPSYIFDQEFTKSIELDKLEDVILGDTDVNHIFTWSSNFAEKFSHYYKVKSMKWPIYLHKKRCSDLNYWINYIIDLLQQIKNKYGRRSGNNIPSDFIDQIKEKIKNLFTEPQHFQCKREEHDYTDKITLRKKLSDYCENRDHLFMSPRNDENCQKLSEFINRKYNCFFNEDTCIIDNYPKENNLLDISPNCSFYNILSTFPYLQCDKYREKYRIQSIPYCPNRHKIDDDISFESPVVGGDYVTELLQNIAFYTCLILLGVKCKIKKDLDESTQELHENLSGYFFLSKGNDERLIAYNPIQMH
ncbi:PIR Superfamily Protein [Plasmodium ovale wallikeri]|uniref:PIR Superfamily Protein n=1 Tax=Plasmodium ovale wallikeri TaxID=864142 RepID=A0A1A9AMW3_PLAOA|nr:PIR Superfamily Protein [Plasmodium ovale wallikeri]SBT57630.1 PIR Superfamily Protein [Plasmodium ovale wallikeri]